MAPEHSLSKGPSGEHGAAQALWCPPPPGPPWQCSGMTQSWKLGLNGACTGAVSLPVPETVPGSRMALGSRQARMGAVLPARDYAARWAREGLCADPCPANTQTGRRTQVRMRHREQQCQHWGTGCTMWVIYGCPWYCWKVPGLSPRQSWDETQGLALGRCTLPHWRHLPTEEERVHCGCADAPSLCHPTDKEKRSREVQ